MFPKILSLGSWKRVPVKYLWTVAYFDPHIILKGR